MWHLCDLNVFIIIYDYLSIYLSIIMIIYELPQWEAS